MSRQHDDTDIACRELVEIVTDYLDGALPVPERERFERHFDACPHCALYLAQLREAITLREVDGLSYEEIAERMQCPIGTVRSRIFRAREAIDEELRPLLDTEPKRERASR